MPGIMLGNTAVKAIMLGNTAIKRVYQGNTLVWSANRIRDDFNRADGALGANWADHGPSTTYKAGVVNQQCRLALPDGLLSEALLTSRQRYTAATADDDDAYLEFRVGSQGSGPSITGDLCKTSVFYRLSNAAFTHGVGVQLDSSTLRIVRRVANAETVMATCGSFAAGDIIRLTPSGNLHTLRRNGGFAGEWNDSAATAAKGSGNRSLGVAVMASKDLLGPRRFGPSIDYVEMG